MLDRKGARWAIVALAIAAAVAAGELASRLALPDIDPSRQIKFVSGHDGTPTLGPKGAALRLVKNTGDFNVAVRFNQQGFRDDKDIAASTPKDIVMMGDSFMMGWGVEQAERTSDRLAALTGRKIYNISLPGGLDGLHELLDYGKRLGGRYGRVVLAVTMEMDIMVYRPWVPGTLVSAAPVAGEPEPARALPGLYDVKLWLRDNSALYFMVTNQIHANPLLNGLAVRFGLIKPNLEGIHHKVLSEEAILSAADQVSAVAEEYETIVLIIPARGLWHGAGRAEEARGHDAFVKTLRDRGLDVVDMRPLMEAGGNPLGLHFANDGHWRPAAHDMAARALAERVRVRWPEGN